jgi:hypothetical protein
MRFTCLNFSAKKNKNDEITDISKAQSIKNRKGMTSSPVPSHNIKFN